MSGASNSATAPSPRAQRHDIAEASALASDGIPTIAVQAYRDAAHRELTVDPSCRLTWPLLAGIGRVESDHGRFAGAVLRTDGVSTPHIIGIPLDGHGTARILDTDHGRLDGDKVYDRAVGPMQFIPSTWAGYGVDGNGDGVIDPFNIFDAAAASAHYLCAAGGNLTTLAGQTRAVRAYNDSDAYVKLVLQLEGVYARGVPGLTVPTPPAGSAPPSHRSAMPPADPGSPLGTRHAPSKKPTSSGSASGSHPPGPSPSPTSATATPPTASSPTAAASPSPSATSCPTATDSASTSASGNSAAVSTDLAHRRRSSASTSGSAAGTSMSGSAAGTDQATSPGTSPTC